MKSKTNQLVVRGVLMLTALELIAISINLFYAPHGVAAGGATGLGIIAQETFGLPVAAVTMGVNAVMLALAWWLLGRGTFKRILFGSIALPLLLALTPQRMIVADRLLAVMVGSVIFALGVGLNYRLDASSGGTTVPPLIFQKYFRIRPAVGLFAVDFVICLLNIPVAGLEAFILAVFAVGLSSLVMDYVETGLDRKKAVYVMSACLPAIKAAIRDKTDHGLTIHSVVGGYSQTPQEMLMIVVEQADFQRLIDGIHRLDPAAFVLAVEATEVHGGSLG
ncbi:YitT family protein [Lacticaseibacillus jixianensis]|uniref:YitT family protein n=1 Tax=Lacticaseibacillus jixianensis TaxID=2486012 RepID=A0ABW4B7G0_9LACO|nr:YitT family protein [Lacticaseibacillus jixianensis]